jgi:cell wall assembly regulator SMI1
VSTKETLMTTTPTLSTIRAQFLAQLEHAAQEIECQLHGPVLDSLAYRQGQQDERERILGLLLTWREQIPSERSFAPIRNCLTTILQSLQR